MSEHFNIHELNKNRDLRKKKRFKIFQFFFKKCLKKIKSMAEYKEYCSYQLPLFAPGLPLFNRQECLIYIFNKLKEMNFEVFINDNQTGIWIFWGHIPSNVDDDSLNYKQPLQIKNAQYNNDPQPKKEYRNITDNNTIKSNFIYDFDTLNKKTNNLFK